MDSGWLMGDDAYLFFQQSEAFSCLSVSYGSAQAKCKIVFKHLQALDVNYNVVQC